MHMTMAGCLGEDYAGKSVYILEDTGGPTGCNVWAYVVRSLQLSYNENEYSLARKLLDDIHNKGHNAFAFYMIDYEAQRIRFHSMKVGNETIKTV